MPLLARVFSQVAFEYMVVVKIWEEPFGRLAMTADPGSLRDPSGPPIGLQPCQMPFAERILW